MGPRPPPDTAATTLPMMAETRLRDNPTERSQRGLCRSHTQPSEVPSHCGPCRAGTSLTCHRCDGRSGTTTGVTGSGDPYNATGDHGNHKTGLFQRHDKEPHHGRHETVPTGGIGYNANAPAAGYGAQPGVGHTHGTHDSTTHSTGNPLTDGHSKASSGGGLFSKKDDLDDSLEKERKAKAELDEAIRR